MEETMKESVDMKKEQQKLFNLNNIEKTDWKPGQNRKTKNKFPGIFITITKDLTFMLLVFQKESKENTMLKKYSKK